MKIDKLFYELLRQYPAGFFELIGRDVRDAKRYRFSAPEMKELSFRFDGIFEPLSKNDITYFVEVQFQRKNDFYSRVFGEAINYIHKTQITKWQSVVIFPSRRAETKNQEALIELIDSRRLKRIYLDELGNDTKHRHTQLFKLIAEPTENTVNKAKALASTATSAEVDFIEQILSVKFSTLTREEIQTMLGVNTKLFKDTQFYKDVFAEGETNAKLQLISTLRQLGLSNTAIAKELNLPLRVVRAAKSRTSVRRARKTGAH
jgi:predicted transposase/invertase (TIGR01784 family)